ncbi:M1 family aminopeptidase [Allomuricauda sp. d1]|uniref:M1 family metallopeptidase n=1 Tax=Allomuricauda sp. d1 TaxID=3136725 RepID=UPI0031D3EDAD
MRLLPFVFVFCFVFQIFSQRQEKVDFIRADAVVTPSFQEKDLKGSVSYHFDVMEKIDSIFLDAKNMGFSKVKINGEKVRFEYDNSKIVIRESFEKGDSNTLSLEYSCKPKQTVYFIGADDDIIGNEEIWTQGQGKYTSHWLPSFDDMNEKVEFDLTIRADSAYTVIANGLLKKKFPKEGMTAWSFDMFRPMSSYLAAFAISDFEKKVTYSKSGVPIELYYEHKDSLKVEPTYRYTKEIFDFLEDEIGVLYPFQNYKQVPVQDFLYAGMENTTLTIFSNQYVIDSTAFVDKNYVNVNAHELAHQWFGNMVTEESGKHHWLHEGFATYYAYLAEQHLFGDDYFYWKLYETAKTLHNLSENGDGEALADPNANSLTFYEKGAWALVMLRERVGEEAFKEGIKNYLNRFAYKNVTIEKFLSEIKQSGGQGLEDFREDWLENNQFLFSEAKTFLKEKSPSLKLLFELEEEFERIQSDDVDFWKYWNASTSIPFKKYNLQKYFRILPKDLVLQAMNSGGLKLRQAIAIAAQDAKQLPKAQFESLLNDAGYVTKENALLKLWASYPEDRTKYLDATKNCIGLPNKNIRLLWLTLALVTEGYHPASKKAYYQELNGYTAAHFNFEVRQLAFQYLSEISAFSDESILNLFDATDHHVWQFRKSARNLLRALADKEVERFDEIMTTISEEKQSRINKILAN